MASILADIGTKVGQELKTLGVRLTSAEAEIVSLGGQTPPPTGSLVANPITWTNLTEINLSGEKVQNTSFDPPPLGLGVEVEVLNSWISGGKTASVGEVYTIDLVQLNGGMRLTNSSQSIFASANQSATQVKALHPREGQVVETITQFSTDLVGREVRSLTTNSNRNMTQGEITTITQINSVGGVLHSGGDGTKEIVIGQQGSGWELLSEIIRKPYLWSVDSGTLDQSKLSEGIIKGESSSVGIDQMFSTPLAVGTKIVVKATRSDFGTGGVAFKHLKNDGNAQGGDISIPISEGFVEYEVVTSDMHGIRFSTNNGAHEISSVSAFQGVVSGGSVQANGNGGIEKISGSDGFNAGASSTNFIEGNSNGYVQFQWGQQGASQQIGLTYVDDDYGNVEPFMMVINGNGHVYTNGSNQFGGGSGWASQGDYFRIRHYASDNTIRFQRREEVYQAVNTTQIVGDLRRATNSWSDAILNEILEIEKIFDDGAVKYKKADGSDFIVSESVSQNNTEAVESIGTDYVTFHTHSELTNGNNLYVDTSLFHVGSRLNDVLLAR